MSIMKVLLCAHCVRTRVFVCVHAIPSQARVSKGEHQMQQERDELTQVGQGSYLVPELHFSFPGGPFIVHVYFSDCQQTALRIECSQRTARKSKIYFRLKVVPCLA